MAKQGRRVLRTSSRGRSRIARYAMSARVENFDHVDSAVGTGSPTDPNAIRTLREYAAVDVRTGKIAARSDASSSACRKVNANVATNASPDARNARITILVAALASGIFIQPAARSRSSPRRG